MSDSLSLSILALIGFCILTEAAREICFKLAANKAAFTSAITKPVTLLGIIFWGVEMLAWAVVLERVPLSIAFPLMALSYVTIMLAGMWMFKEHVNMRHFTGALLITAGAACVGATGL